MRRRRNRPPVVSEETSRHPGRRLAKNARRAGECQSGSHGSRLQGSAQHGLHQEE